MVFKYKYILIILLFLAHTLNPWTVRNNKSNKNDKEIPKEIGPDATKKGRD